MKKNRLFITVSLMMIFFAGFFICSGNTITQPIKYNHYKHVEEAGMECLSCHEYYETQASAGLPQLEICADCHEESQGESIEETTIVEFIQNESEINWEKVYKLPKHVLFSHRRHVVLGELECQVCHGEMSELTVPPQVGQNKLTMDSCMDCHEILNASNDCLACHR